MYAKIKDQTTKEVIVGSGTSIAFYKSLGMTEMDVEQAYDGRWFVTGYAPSKPEPSKEEKLAELDNQYDKDKAEIIKYYNEAIFAEDTETMADLKEEMAEIDAKYKADRKAIEEGSEE